MFLLTFQYQSKYSSKSVEYRYVACRTFFHPRCRPSVVGKPASHFSTTTVVVAKPNHTKKNNNQVWFHNDHKNKKTVHQKFISFLKRFNERYESAIYYHQLYDDDRNGDAIGQPYHHYGVSLLHRTNIGYDVTRGTRFDFPWYGYSKPCILPFIFVDIVSKRH